MRYIFTKNNKYAKGFSVSAIIVIIAVIVLGGGAYYYFNKSHSAQNIDQQSSSSNNLSSSNQNPDQVIVESLKQVSSISSTAKACDYLTASELSSIFESTVHQFSYQPSNMMCLYSAGTNDRMALSLAITMTNASSEVINGNYKQTLKIGAKSLQGIGDMASEMIINPTKDDGSVVVYFFKKGTIGTVTVNIWQGQASIKAENLAKLVTDKIGLGVNL